MKIILIVPCLLLQTALAQTVTANPSLTAPGGIVFATNATNQVTEDPTFLWTPATHRWDVPVGFNIFLGGERFFSMYPDQWHTSANMFLGLSSGNQTNAGYNNVAFGINSLSRLTTGQGNTAISHDTLDYVTTGYNNTAVGYKALENTDGGDNTAVGWAAGNLLTGTAETALGYASLYVAKNALFDTAVGFKALHQEQSGGENVAVGASTGASTLIGTYNTFVGMNAGSNGDYSHSGALGANAQATKSHQIALGTASEEVYAPGSFNSPMYQVSGTKGLTATLTVMGSSQNIPCQLVFTSGLLTSTTCQ